MAFSKFGKYITPEGQQMFWSNVVLTSAGLTGIVMPAGGVSGASVAANPSPLWVDVYGINLSSNDTTVEQVTLSDGTNTINWFVTTSPLTDGALVPYRFNANVPLVVSAGAVTAAKSIAVGIRGVVTKT